VRKYRNVEINVCNAGSVHRESHVLKEGWQFHELVGGEQNSIISVNKEMMETENAGLVKEAIVTYSLQERR